MAGFGMDLVQIPNFAIDGPDPGLAAMEGFYGARENARRDQLAQISGNVDMRAQQQADQERIRFGQEQAALQQQQQAQAQMAARAREAESALAALADKISEGTARAGDFAALQTQFPEMSEGLKEPIAALEEDRRKSYTSLLYRSAIALKSNKPEVAAQLFKDRAEAARNSGDAIDADLSEATAEMIMESKDDPAEMLAMLGILGQSFDPKMNVAIFGEGEGGEGNQTERDIALLGEIGFSRPEAIRITQLHDVSRDPVTGEAIILNRATGQRVQGPGGQIAPPPAAPPSGSEKLSFGEAFKGGPNVFGVEGAIKGLANTVTDVIPGIATAFPKEQQTAGDFRVLQEQIVNDVASAYERQPPSWLLQNIRDLTPTPGKVFEGPDEATAKLRSLGRAFQQEMGAVDQQLASKISPAQRQQLEARRIGLETALNRVRSALQGLNPKPSVSQSDVDLMNQLLGGQ